MVLKKKQTGLHVFLLVLFCILFLSGFSNNCKAYSNSSTPNTSLDDTWLSTDSMIAIIENLKVESVNSGEITFAEYMTGYEEGTADYYINYKVLAKNLADTFNTWFLQYSYNYDIDIGDIFFTWGITTNSDTDFQANKYLTFFINSDSSPWVDTFVPAFNLWSFTNTNRLSYVRFKQFNYDGYGNITGYQQQNASNNLFTLNQQAVSSQTLSSNYAPAYYFNKDFILNTLNETLYNTAFAYLTFNNQERLRFFAVYKNQINNTTAQYGGAYLSYKINLGSGDTPTPTPTPTGTSTPVPTGGGGSSDSSNIENGISNIQNSLTTTPSGDDFISITSGDMLSALDLPAIEDPTANFWLSITDGLTTALTCPNNTTIEIPLLTSTFTVNCSDFELPDGDLKKLIRMSCVVGFVLVEYKLIRKIIAYFSSGVFKQIFNAYSRMDISDLF